MAAPSAARACSWVPFVPYQLSDARDDDTAPGIPSAGVVTVDRGREGDGANCGEVASVRIAVTASDDRTLPGSLGFRLTVVDGTPPVGFTVPSDAIRQYPDGSVSVAWSDVEYDEPFRFSVTLRAVDGAGNVGPPSAPIPIDLPAGGGCQIGGRGGAEALLPLGLLALALVLRRIVVRRG